jgi:RecG-like helicase
MKMKTDNTWDIIQQNIQRVAEEGELVQPGCTFSLTTDQAAALDELSNRLQNGDKRILLKAPTGSGKTEVFFRTCVREVLRTGKHVIVLVPTRDLARQQANYFDTRLEETGFDVAQMHAGVPPRTRRDEFAAVEKGKIKFVVGSALLLKGASHRRVLDEAALLVVDDINAFDEDEDLVHLRGLKCPMLFVTATPDAVARFLKNENVLENPVRIHQLPFDSPPTEVEEVRGEWNENAFKQVERAMPALTKHIEAGSRIYLISKTRAKVPIMADFVRERLKVPVSILHGEMADSSEHRKRQRKTSGVTEDRVSMMKQFRDNSPAVLVATNLVGSGLDVPMADLLVVTDADHFGIAEIEQLLGRVGRRHRASDAVLVRGTAASAPKGVMTRSSTRIRNGKVVQTFRLRPQSRRGYNPRRVV